MNLLIIGMGGHGYVVKEVAENMNVFDHIDFVDDHNEKAIGTIKDLKKLRDTYDTIHVSIGNLELREQSYKEAKKYNYCTLALIDPSAYVSQSAEIDEGTLVEPKAIINANTKIGKGCIISVGSIVDHNAEVGDYCHINSGAILKAGSKVENYTRIDAGEVVKGY